MSGIYVHIPFCKQACTYCDFHFSTQQALRKPLVDALCMEIEQRRSELSAPPRTLYFGGGSPSILDAPELERIFEALHSQFDLSQVEEVTLESNPDDHNSEKLRLWKGLGIHRLSIGIQSFIDRDLQFMNRAHNAQEARGCIDQAREAGFRSMTLDLIYGIPGQSMAEWKENLERVIELNPEHISAYCLTVEDRTALHHQVTKGSTVEKEDEVIEAEFAVLRQLLLEAGYEHYEVSNFAKPGKRARHNGMYWSGAPYLGIGPAAHSYDGSSNRRWNVSNNAAYIKAIENGDTYWEEETLSEVDRINERIMTGLRRKEGIDLSELPENEKLRITNHLGTLPPTTASLFEFKTPHLIMRPSHWLLTDRVIRELMILKE